MSAACFFEWNTINCAAVAKRWLECTIHNCHPQNSVIDSHNPLVMVRKRYFLSVKLSEKQSIWFSLFREWKYCDLVLQYVDCEVLIKGWQQVILYVCVYGSEFTSLTVFCVPKIIYAQPIDEILSIFHKHLSPVLYMQSFQEQIGFHREVV